MSRLERQAVTLQSRDDNLERLKAQGVQAAVQDSPLERENKNSIPLVLTPEEERRLWRKIDLRLLPIATTIYLVSFLDRGNIGNAKLQGLDSQLNLTGDQYNIALTMFFLGYSCFAVLSNLVFKRLTPSKFLSSITVIWGIITTLMGLVKNYPQLVGVRVCLGIAESGMVGGVFYHFSLWYPRHMLQTRIGIFWAGATLAGAFSGLLSFGIAFMSGRGGLLGWSWIFIIEGMVTVVVGVVSYFGITLSVAQARFLFADRRQVLVDLPDTATFLTPEERAYVIYRKKFDNSSVGEEEHFELRHVWEAVLDWQVWALSMVNMSVLSSVYGLTFFLPSIINGFGFNTTISQLLTVPVYFVATINVMIWAIWGDHLKMRSPFDFMGLSLAAIGYGINLSNASIGVKYFGSYVAAIGAYGAFPATSAWMANNVAGHYKRAVALGMIVTWGNCGGFITSNVYRTQDAPRYVLGHAAELVVILVGLVTTLVTAFTYSRINERRDERQRGAAERGHEYSNEEIRRGGDRAPDFRYTL